MTLFKKELFDLAPAVGGFAAMQAITVFIAWRSGSPEQQAQLAFGALIGGLFMAAFFGALHGGLEMLQGTRSFLLALPVPRRTICASKVAAAAFSCALLCFLGWIWTRLFNDVEALRPDRVPLWALVAALFLYAATARLSLVFPNPIGALTVVAIFVLVATLIFFDAARAIWSSAWFVPVVALAATATLVDLARAWDRLEDRAPDLDEGIGGRVFEGFSGSLFALEARRCAGLGLVLAIAIPWILFGGRLAYLSTLLVLPIVGSYLGVRLWSEEERDGVGFFLHHQPISKVRLLAVRGAVAAAAGALLAGATAATWIWSSVGGEMGAVGAFLGTWRGWFAAPAAIAPVYLAVCGFAFSFAFGAMISARTSHTSLGMILAVLTWFCVSTIGPVAFMVPSPVHAIVWIAALGIAFLANVLGRALEPLPHRGLRALLILAPFWLLGLWSFSW